LRRGARERLRGICMEKIRSNMGNKGTYLGPRRTLGKQIRRFLRAKSANKPGKG